MTIVQRSPLASLTILNQRLLAQADEETVAEQAIDLGFGPTGEQPPDPDPDADDDGEKEVRGRFFTADPLEANRVKEWIEQNVFGGSASGMSPLITAFVNEWDVEVRRREGLGPEDDIGTGATLERLLGEDDFVNGATWLPLTSAGRLPPIFTTSLPEVDENGEETGNMRPSIAVSSPLAGVTFHTIEEVAAQSAETRDVFRRLLRSDSALAKALFSSAIKQEKTDTLPIPGRAETELALVGSVGGEGIRSTGRPAQPPTPAPPEISPDELTAMWKDALGGGGRGGGGGGSRRDITFDRNHLISQVEDLWNRRMLSPDPAPEGTIGAWVDSYIRDAKAFWAKDATQLDFGTFVESKMESHPRYQQIYKHKQPGETPEQFLQKFAQPISQFGQSGEFTRSQTEAAVTSGGAPIEQARRVSRERQVQLSGGFSQELARTFAGLGI